MLLVVAALVYLHVLAPMVPAGVAAIPALALAGIVHATGIGSENVRSASILVLVGLAGVDLARLPPWAPVVQAIVWIGAVAMVDQWQARLYQKAPVAGPAALGVGLGAVVAVGLGVSLSPAQPLAVCLAWAAARWFGHRVTRRTGWWGGTATAVWLPAIFFTTWWGPGVVLLEVVASALMAPRGPIWAQVLHSATVLAALAFWVLR